jgi:hypothetical protein
MKAITTGFGPPWIGLLASFVMGAATFAQSGAVAPATTGTSITLDTFQQEQQALVQEWETLASQGATQDQQAAWYQQIAPRIQAQQQRADALGAASALQPLPTVTRANIPPGASQTLKNFLTTQALLANAHARLHNQLLQSLPSGATPDQISAIHQQEIQAFQQQHAADLTLQSQRAAALAAASASQPLPVPRPAAIPPNATPQWKAYLTARDALALGWVRNRNQYLTADPATRQAAIQQWQQQNAARLDQLRQLAQQLSNPTVTQ